MNGSDQDSDSIYVTNNPAIVRHAEYCYLAYPTVVNNIPKEQLKGFDDCLSYLFYFKLIEENTNILIPDLCEYYFKTSKEVEQTLNLINQIPQEKRKGKYTISISS